MYITLVVFILLVATLLSGKVRSLYAFTGASFILILLNVIDVHQFIDAFANTSILSIFVLIFLTRVFREHFNVVGWLNAMYSNTHHPRWFVLKNSLGISLLSSVMNNTPIVALMIPYTYHWGEKHNISPSKLLMPVSFAAITGGMITVIGTSTNLVLNGFLESSGLPLLTLTDYFIPGVAVSIVAAIYASTWGYKLLPDRNMTGQKALNSKQYVLEVALSADTKMHQKTVEQAHLRNVKGAYLVEIIRKDQVIRPVTPDTILLAGDRLMFAGDHEAVDELVKMTPDFNWGKTDQYNLGKSHGLMEAVIPFNSNLIGSTLKKDGFRAKYGAAVVGIHRNGEKLRGRLGDIALQAGDLLIIASGTRSENRFKGQKNLYVINSIQQAINDKERNGKQWAFLGFVAVGLALNFFAGFSFFVSLLFMLGGAVVLKLTNTKAIKEDLNIELLMILGGAIAMGTAMVNSGVGEALGDWIQLGLPILGSWTLLLCLMLLTVLLTSFVTNVAAVSIIFPVVYALAPVFDMPLSVVFVAIAFSASAAFITPVSYQTNLMVQAPGGYSNRDFLKYGLPMLVLYFIVVLGYLFLIS